MGDGIWGNSARVGRPNSCARWKRWWMCLRVRMRRLSGPLHGRTTNAVGQRDPYVTTEDTDASARGDYEYESAGTANVILFTESCGARRQPVVSEPRRAGQNSGLPASPMPLLTLVNDNLNCSLVLWPRASDKWIGINSCRIPSESATKRRACRVLRNQQPGSFRRLPSLVPQC